MAQGPGGEVRFPHQYAAELRVQIEQDPVFAALVLGPKLPEPRMEAINLEEEETLKVDLLDL